jgi:hypothetical protein
VRSVTAAGRRVEFSGRLPVNTRRLAASAFRGRVSGARGSRALLRLLVFLSPAYLGLAYPLALFAGTSHGYRFWVALGQRF